MINFRYHVVSLAAVFLALAIGLVVGTAALNGPLTEDFKGRLDKITADADQYRSDLDHTRAEVDKQEEYATQTAPMVLGGKLTDQRVLLVSLPYDDNGVDKAVDRVSRFLGDSGAKVTGRVKLTEKFVAPTNNDALLDLAQRSAPPGVSGVLPNQSDGVENSTTLLSSLLLGRTATIGAADTRNVLKAYEDAGFITSSALDLSSPAQSVVIVAARPATGKDADKKNHAMVTIVDRFQWAGKVVVAGLSDTGVVGAVRGEAALAKVVATVDNAATADGQVGAVLVLVEQIGGKTGHYGIGSGSTALIPKPASAHAGP